eukprot:3449265-Prymnesium_polylepis.1
MEPVPAFLQGCWIRHYIRRAVDDGSLGPEDTSPVRYVQTPHAFCDVRSRSKMAFAGVTTAEPASAGGGARVHWHACHNLEEETAPTDAEARWTDALAGTPRPTEDVGDFVPLSGCVWRETDPGHTLEEEWERIDDGGGRFLAVRRPGALLVVAGGWFGYAEDAMLSAPDSPPYYAAGDVTADGWTVVLSTEGELEGKPFLGLLGALRDWQHLLPGSTISWEELPSAPAFRSEAPDAPA